MQKRLYHLEKQETHYYCLPAVVQAILRRHNLLKETETQRAIAEKLKATPERGVFFGKDLHDFLNERGLLFAVVKYHKVKSNKPEILVKEAFEDDADLVIGYLNGGGMGHAVLVTEYDGHNIKVLNPRDASDYPVNLKNLYQEMKAVKFGNFGLVSKL